ncbi:MAG: type II toxin-antitoxin system Phd/YefM family antitoxin [Verrucomicrobia bacterium]|nr:type II toxin-antitoxin system Phd/YefM family antitoxin [Verrucomicrobiota bacterium]MBO4714480.1 type II toxin-antitoxin system Phd/YefM family antitoxin [Verrucomicrobiota bacterium]MBR5737277.1 type II toxin-antitoxin system Phd/YefM family antitoxin [Verrucomicrobiota bacterium]MBR5978618.1 type II toxin-antitoxin system Phd/YefM family antitoxin [Verrucomicrobiota bacterium]MBR6460255.1 type II toxin-antitoxin system Phd/YefM family antitoxin [Verrucomicrobiota bacterium]
MNELSYTATRKNLAKTIESVVRDRTPVIIRKKKDSVVMMCLEDYEAWAETVYLLKSPKNAERLLSSISELERGDAVEKSLEELLNGEH